MKRVLIVEDDQALAMGIEFALDRENFSVKVAQTFEEGYRCFLEGDFDLILLDVMLPDGNGYELCKRVRETSDLPVIFLTACDEEVNVVQGLDLGGDDYITKPFRVKELLSRIKAALRRSPGGSVDKTHIISGGIQIYPLEAKVLKKGSPLQLTPGEYKLLNLLMSNGDLALSRAMILEKLWDVEGEFVDDNTLSVYIRRLREKIEDNPSKPEHILTVRGIGYKWVGGIQSHEKLFFQS